MAKSKELTRPKFREWLGQYSKDSKVGRFGATPVQRYMKQKGISSEVELPKWAQVHTEVAQAKEKQSMTASAALSILDDLK